METTIEDLLPEDIVYEEIFPRLSQQDLVNLRCARKEFKPLVDGYIATLKAIDWEGLTPAILKVFRKKSRNLREIDPPSNINLDNTNLKPILERNKRITRIALRSCYLLTEKGVHPIVHLKNLTHLIIRRNGWVDDTFVGRLTMYLQSDLRAIDFSKCPVSDTSLIGFFRKFKLLTDIDVEKIPKMTDMTLYTIAENCHNLENLNIIGNKQLTEDAVRAVVDASPKIRSIVLMGCTQISQEYRDSIIDILLYEL